METGQLAGNDVIPELNATQSIVTAAAAGIDPSADQKRRSSSRSIKRKRFDDEIVEYSLGLQPSQVNRVARSRTQSQSQTASAAVVGIVSAATSSPAGGLATGNLVQQQQIVVASESGVVTTPIAPATPSTPQPTTPILAPTGGGVVISQPPPPIPVKIPVAAMPSHERRKSNKSSKKSRKSRGTNQLATKDLGRWKPIDDLALIIGIQQTNDLRMVHRGTKFSCKFTMQEMQARWYSLLYEEPISRIAVTAMRNLHPEMVEHVQSRALYTVQEEELLGTIKSTESPTPETFQELLEKHPSVFYPARTAKALLNHWTLMKQYSLLPDQTVKPIPVEDHTLSFSDAEEALNDNELFDHKDEALEIELALADRKNKKEIRHLENELSRWTVLVDSLAGVGFTPEFDNQTLAVLRGRLVRYLMRSKEITFGRSAKELNVDVDLSLEGPAHKVSRKQGTIKLRSNGDFFISNEGKRAIYIDGMPLLQGNKSRLNNNCVVEIAGLRFVFLVNYDLINAIRHESAKTTVPLN